MKLTATEFFQFWQQTYAKRINEILPYWDDKRAYTKQMISVLSDIADQTQLELCTEYYSVDAILFDSEDLIKDKQCRYIINQEILFEHENSVNNILPEIAHLLRLDAELYVVVGYHDMGSVDMDYLDSLLPMMQISRKSASLVDKANFLIILGDCSNYVQCDYWKGFVYGGSQWIPLESLPGVTPPR